MPLTQPCRLLLMVLLTVATCWTARADSIELWSGQVATDVTVGRIEDGFLYYTRAGSEEESKVKVANVKTISKPKLAPVELLMLKKVTKDRRTWYNLGIGIADERERIHEPLVRVFVLDADDKGIRTAQAYTNRRNQDPTLMGDAPKIDASSYKARYWQILADSPLAWHIEVWQDGQRTWTHDAVSDQVEGLAADWWQTQDYRRGAVMKEISVSGREGGDGEVATSEREAEESEEPPPVAVQITAAGTRGDMNQSNHTYNVSYVLRSIHVEDVPTPAATVYFLSETSSGKRRVTTLVLDAGGSNAELRNAMYSHSLEVALPDNLTHGLDIGVGENDLDADKRREKLLAWRLELTYGEKAMAVKERGPEDLLASLPKDWYK